MQDPSTQTQVDQAIKRDANVTPTEFRDALQATAIDFVRRTDAQDATRATVSEPRRPESIQVTTAEFSGQAAILPQVAPEEPSFPNNTLPQGGVTADITVCVEDPLTVFTTMVAHFQNGILTSLS